METDLGAPVRCGSVEVPAGQIHFAQADTGAPVRISLDVP